VDGEPGFRAAAGGVVAMPGSRSYVRLAEAGYLVSAALVLVYVVVLAVAGETVFTNGLMMVFASAAIGLVLSVAWFQLGRRQGISWFMAAGVFGGASAVLSVFNLLESSGPLSSFSIAITFTESIVTLTYFAAQLLAFYKAAKVFRVRLFMYATYLLAIGFVVTPIASVLLVAATAFHPVVSQYLAYSAYGMGLLFSAGTSLAAAVGFHRLMGASPDPRYAMAGRLADS
jgi:hypothetical protein